MVFIRENQRHFKGRFLRRLVPTGEGPAGVRGLELGGGEVAGLPVLRGVLRPVEAHQLVVQPTGEDHLQPGIARLDGFAEFQRCSLGIFIDSYRFAGQSCPIGVKGSVADL